jgi:hypothetical protein
LLLVATDLAFVAGRDVSRLGAAQTRFVGRCRCFAVGETRLAFTAALTAAVAAFTTRAALFTATARCAFGLRAILGGGVVATGRFTRCLGGIALVAAVTAFATLSTFTALATFPAFSAGAGRAFCRCIAFIASRRVGRQLLRFEVAVDRFGRHRPGLAAFAFAAFATAAAALFAFTRTTCFTGFALLAGFALFARLTLLARLGGFAAQFAAAAFATALATTSATAFAIAAT